MKKFVATLTSIAFILATTAVVAQPVPEVGVEPTTTSAPEKLKRVDFTEGDEIKGTIKTGAGDVIGGETHDKLKNLIEVKVNFVDELMKSADEL